MTGREWKPGDVALVTALNRRAPYRAYFDGQTWRSLGSERFCVDVPEAISPLVVIDPEGKQVERMREAYERSDQLTLTGAIRDALRSLIEPPKPEVYEHLAIKPVPGGASAALCGKVWRPSDAVAVVGRCPECVDIANSGWVA